MNDRGIRIHVWLTGTMLSDTLYYMCNFDDHPNSSGEVTFDFCYHHKSVFLVKEIYI